MNVWNSQQKQIFVVLGISRSGTSAIARSLKVLGIDLGHQLLSGNQHNPKGYWEDSDILYRVNRGVSHELGDPWRTIDSMDEVQIQNNVVLSDYKNLAINILKDRFRDQSAWGFKDPRTTTILPFWQCVFKEMAMDDRYVITVRHPLAVAYSNQEFFNIDIEMGLLLWLVHLVSAIDGTQGKKRVLVSYEAMLQQPRAQLIRMHQALDINIPLDMKEVDLYAHTFLDNTLRHYTFDDESLTSHPAMAVAPLCLQLYEVLLQLSNDEMVFDSIEFHSTWRMIKAEFAKLYPIYNYIHAQHLHALQLKREIRKIRKSLPWKLIFPLRKVDDFLRFYRIKAKEARRRLA